MENLTQQQQDHVNHIMRCIQKRFVEHSLAQVIDAFDEADGFPRLVTAVALKCRENGCRFSEPLVQELILEIAQGFPEWASGK